MGFSGWIRRRRRLLTVLAALVMVLVVGLSARAYITIRDFEHDQPLGAPTYLDRDGRIISTLGSGPRVYAPVGVLPEHLLQAVIAIEDARFYRHPGIDPIGILRAAWVNYQAGTRLQGASTITQQLAKNAFLTPEKTMVRKMEEMLLAFAMEMRYSKDHILELYLNQVYFGEGAHGIESAARTYFGKSASELDLAESALLAAILRAPGTYSPYRNPERARLRQQLVLQRMSELGLIAADQAQAAAEQEVPLARRRGGDAPYFTDYLQQQLIEKLGPYLVFDGGLHIQTTLDMRLQKIAQQALGDRQGAIIAMDPRNGEILAMVGGRNYLESQFNRAVQAVRQPGSAFKPVIYAAALERGWRLSSLIEDVHRTFGDYEPANWNHEYWGSVTLKHGLVRSLNNGTVWLLRQMGPNAALDMAGRLGFTTVGQTDRHLALALGGLTRGVIPLEMTGAMVVLANGGVRYPPAGIRRVTDQQGREWYQHTSEARRVISQEVAYLLTDALRAAIEYGTGTRAQIGRPAAGKTGTTNHFSDAWFAGYTPDLAAVVYVGHDDNRPLEGGGGIVAAPIWREFMRNALADVPIRDFPTPPNVATGISVDLFTGLRATENCPHRQVDAFVRGTEPVRFAPCAWGIASGEEPSPDTDEPTPSPTIDDRGLLLLLDPDDETVPDSEEPAAREEDPRLPDHDPDPHRPHHDDEGNGGDDRYRPGDVYLTPGEQWPVSEDEQPGSDSPQADNDTNDTEEDPGEGDPGAENDQDAEDGSAQPGSGDGIPEEHEDEPFFFMQDRRRGIFRAA